jgi:hypothetical protein
VVGVLVAVAFIFPVPARWWHCQHDTSSARTPLARMLPRVIGGPAWESWSIAHAGEDIRPSSATASSGRCALLRDTVPDQGEGRSAAGTGEGEAAGSTPIH